MSTGPADKMECKDAVGLSLGEVKKEIHYRVEVSESIPGAHMKYYVIEQELTTVLNNFIQGTNTKLEITKEN